MAKIENTKMTVSLDNDSKRILRNLTKAVDRLSRNMMPFKVEDGVTRLMEPQQTITLSPEAIKRIAEATEPRPITEEE